MTIIERVARAIVEARTPGLNLTPTYLEDVGYMDEARAAIAAMREPTEAMLEWRDGAGITVAASAVHVWQAMIDAALEEK